MEKSSSDPGLRNSESLESCAIPNSTSINRSDEIEDLTVSRPPGNDGRSVAYSPIAATNRSVLGPLFGLQNSKMDKIYPNHTLYNNIHTRVYLF